MSKLPADLRYTHDHEWLRATGERWRAGITRFAVGQLGDITAVELPEEGDLITKGQRFGRVKGVKTGSDLYGPVSGRVAAVNGELKASPGRINAEPYEGGWMIEIQPSDKGELDELLDAAAYGEHVAAQ